MPTEVIRKRFTVDEYHRMGEAGILGPEYGVELMDGEIIEMRPIGPGTLAVSIAPTRCSSRRLVKEPL